MASQRDAPGHHRTAQSARRGGRSWWVLLVVALVVGLVIVVGDDPTGSSASGDRHGDRPGDTGNDTVGGPPRPFPMSPPVDTSLVQDLSRAAQWEPENGGFLEQLPETGPVGDPVLRNTLVDGQAGAAGAASSERNDLQGGIVPLGSVRWMTWNERFVEMPETDLDRWQVIGPNEIHGQTLPQATVMPEVGPDERRRLNANAGLEEPRYFDLGEIELGEWSSLKFGIHYTDEDDGWMELWRDGVRLVRVDGPTTAEPIPGYWKFGHYRNAAIDGTSVYDVSGVRVYGPQQPLAGP